MKLNKFLAIVFFIAVIVLQLFSCQKDYSYEQVVISQGSLIKDAFSNCMATASGTYQAGTALTSDNFILDSIHITSAGAYAITTDTINGIYFKANGQVSTTGDFEIKLTGIGTPVKSGTYNYTVTYDSSSCGVSVAVIDAQSNNNNDTGYMNAFIDGDSTGFNYINDSLLMQGLPNGDTLTTFLLTGFTDASHTTIINLTLTTTGSLTTGTYSSSNMTTGSVECVYTSQSDTWTGGGNATTSSGSCTITINSISSTRITGTFSGTLLVSTSGTSPDVTITNGAFDIPYP